MTVEENIKAILESNFTETKPEIIDIAHKNIMSLSILDRDANPYFEGYSQGYSDGYREGEKIKKWRTEGYWEWVQYDANPEIGNFHCSVCGYIPASFNMSAQKLNYCPNCGAKMQNNER